MANGEIKIYGKLVRDAAADKVVDADRVGGLSKVATSGDYTDLDNKPDIALLPKITETEGTITKTCEARQEITQYPGPTTVLMSQSFSDTTDRAGILSLDTNEVWLGSSYDYTDGSTGFCYMGDVRPQSNGMGAVCMTGLKYTTQTTDEGTYEKNRQQSFVWTKPDGILLEAVRQQTIDDTYQTVVDRKVTLDGNGLNLISTPLHISDGTTGIDESEIDFYDVTTLEGSIKVLDDGVVVDTIASGASIVRSRDKLAITSGTVMYLPIDDTVARTMSAFSVVFTVTDITTADSIFRAGVQYGIDGRELSPTLVSTGVYTMTVTNLKELRYAESMPASSSDYYWYLPVKFSEDVDWPATMQVTVTTLKSSITLGPTGVRGDAFYASSSIGTDYIHGYKRGYRDYSSSIHLDSGNSGTTVLIEAPGDRGEAKITLDAEYVTGHTEINLDADEIHLINCGLTFSDGTVLSSAPVLYEHNIYGYYYGTGNEGMYFTSRLITKSPDKIEGDLGLATALYTNEFIDTRTMCPASGIYKAADRDVIGIYGSSDTDLYAVIVPEESISTPEPVCINDYIELTDYVRCLIK